MYNDFDEYPTYTGAIYYFFETNIDVHIKCCHGCHKLTPKVIMMTWINNRSW